MRNTPDLTRDLDHFTTGKFFVHQKVYVFDENNFDIHEGVITRSEADRVWIHYQKWPCDSGWVSKQRLLPVTAKNTDVFCAQEKLREQAGKHETSENDSESKDNRADLNASKEGRAHKKKAAAPEGEVLVSTHGLQRGFVVAFDQELHRHNPEIALDEVDRGIKELAELCKRYAKR
jgi:hypothetical protein